VIRPRFALAAVVRTWADHVGSRVRAAKPVGVLSKALGLMNVAVDGGWTDTTTVRDRPRSVIVFTTLTGMRTDFTRVKTSHVAEAVAMCDAFGLDGLIPGRHFEEAAEYDLVCDGRVYPSKAIILTSYYLATGIDLHRPGGEDLTDLFMRKAGPFDGLSVSIRRRSEAGDGDGQWFADAGDEGEDRANGLPAASETAVEGVGVDRVVRCRTRSRRLRRLMVLAMRQQVGRLQCEVCGIVPGDVYGGEAADVVDVHHVVPLKTSGETLTSMDGLAVVCPTCHRALHSFDPVPQPDALRSVVEDRRRG